MRLMVMVFSIGASFTAIQALLSSSSGVWNTALMRRASEAWGPGREERESGDPATPRKLSSGEREKLQTWKTNPQALSLWDTAVGKDLTKMQESQQ